jgi:hypothetical protein
MANTYGVGLFYYKSNMKTVAFDGSMVRMPKERLLVL